MKTDWVAPPWVDAVWEEARKVWDAETVETRQLALRWYPDTSVREAVERVKAWKAAMRTQHCQLLKATLTVWWWSRTGETRHPSVEEIEAFATDRR